MITVEKYLEIDSQYEKMTNDAHDNLHKVINGRFTSMGLVSDEVKSTQEYKEAKKKFDQLFNMARNFRKTVPSNIKRKASEIRRKEKYGFAF